MELLPSVNKPVVKQPRVPLQVKLPPVKGSKPQLTPLATIPTELPNTEALISSIVPPSRPPPPARVERHPPSRVPTRVPTRVPPRVPPRVERPPPPRVPTRVETEIRGPTIVVKTNRLTPEERVEWAKGLQEYLFNDVLNLVEPNIEFRKKLVSPRAMDIWMNAFTHKTYNRNRGENYEGLEKVGDAGLKIAFTTYILKRFPHLDQRDLTLLNAHYLGKSAQAPMSRNLGLDRWVLLSVDMNTHIFEDLLESVAGALLIIGNTEFEVGVGYTLIYNLIVSIFREIEIDPTIFKGHPKSQVKELFGGLHWITKKIEEIETWVSNPDGVSGTMTLQLTSTALSHLQRLQMTIPSPILAVAEGTTQTVASNLAYTQALDKLNSLGITSEWASSQRGRTNFDHPDLAAYYSTALARARREGYLSIDFEVPRKGTRGCYVQLIGRTADGRLEILATASNCSTGEGRRAVLRFYAENS